MSKMDNLRAMREAKYAAAQKRAAAGPVTSAVSPPVAPASPAEVRSVPADSEDTNAAGTADRDELCGHRNMSGRTCTRERGHAAKSHRYS